MARTATLAPVVLLQAGDRMLFDTRDNTLCFIRDAGYIELPDKNRKILIGYVSKEALYNMAVVLGSFMGLQAIHVEGSVPQVYCFEFISR